MTISRADYIARVTVRLLELSYPMEVAAEGALTLSQTVRGNYETPEQDAWE